MQKNFLMSNLNLQHLNSRLQNALVVGWVTILSQTQNDYGHLANNNNKKHALFFEGFVVAKA